LCDFGTFSRVKAGIPVPVKHLPDPTRTRRAPTRPDPYPRVRVYPQTPSRYSIYLPWSPERRKAELT